MADLRRQRAVAAALLVAAAAPAPRAHPRPPAAASRYGVRHGTGGACTESTLAAPVDGALCDAARLFAHSLVGAGSGHAEDAVRARMLSFLLRREGVADGSVQPLVVHGHTRKAILATLRAALGKTGAHAAFGVALAGAGTKHIGVLLVARRLATLSPLPRVSPPGDPIVVEGELASGVKGPRAFVSLPDGTAHELLVAHHDGQFRFVVATRAPGTYHVELLADAGEGPETAILAPIYVGTAPPEAPSPVLVDGSGTPEAHLEAAVDKLRHARRLDAPTRDAVLDRIATAKARLVARVGRPVHRPRGGADSTPRRLTQAGYAFAWAAEDLAEGPGAMPAFQGLVESPAHLAVLLDPRARRMGIGVARAGRRTFIALVLTEPMGARAKVRTAGAARVVRGRLLFRAENAIGRLRAARGLGTAFRDPDLDDLASALARRLSARDVGDDASADDAVRARVRAADPTVEHVGIGVVVAGTPEAIARAPAVLDPGCDRIGLGVAEARSVRFAGDRLWLVAVCAAHAGAP